MDIKNALFGHTQNPPLEIPFQFPYGVLLVDNSTHNLWKSNLKSYEAKKVIISNKNTEVLISKSNNNTRNHDYGSC